MLLKGGGSGEPHRRYLNFMSQELQKPYPDILRPMAVMLAITLATVLTASAVMVSISG